MGKKSQSKGRSGELELCRILQDYGYPVEPGHALNYGTEPDIKGLLGVHIECKRAEQLRLHDWMEQSRHDAEKFQDGLPAVFHRRNREGWLVTMPLDAWLTLYRRQKAPEKRSREERVKSGT